MRRDGKLIKKNIYKKKYQNFPLITIITVNLNQYLNLKKTIESVLNQKYEHIEYIVIDGGSTDGTLELLKKYENSLDYWVSEPDKGISDAFNKGIQLAHGDYIMLLNAGDCILPNAFSHDSIFKNHKVLSMKSKIIESGKFLPSSYRYNPNPQMVDDHIRNCLLSHQATLVAKSVYDDIGLYNLDYRIRMDLDFFLRASKKYTFHYLDRVIVLYSATGISSQLKYRFLSKIEEYRIIKRHFQITFRYKLLYFIRSIIFLTKKALSAAYYRVKRYERRAGEQQ